LRIENLDMATQIDEEELAWFRHTTPITEHHCRQIAQSVQLLGRTSEIAQEEPANRELEIGSIR
jgi:hypothetical protein